MKTSTALTAMLLGLSLTPAAEAQSLFNRPGTTNPRSVPGPKPAPAAGDSATRDPKVLPSGVVVPEPVVGDDKTPPAIPLPPEPIEDYLLTQENGPFMVLAYTFKGAYADKYAQALAMELRAKFGLPAYVFRPKDFPMRSNIRGVPPTANPGVIRPIIGWPEVNRIKDEAAVLVGNEKTLDGSEKLLKHVKALHPACLDAIPEIYQGRKAKGMKWAIRTTNPYAPAEVLFPRKPDVMVTNMNQGPHSIFTCPGQYSLQIAEFGGRKAIYQGIETDKQFMFASKRSPLASAAEDAEKLAASLAKDKQVMQTGYVPYVYHDRYASKVMIGAFNKPNDPAANRLRDDMLKMAVDLNTRKVTSIVIVPAPTLTDLTPMKAR